MTPELIRDWTRLDSRHVEIRRDGKTIDRGRVDLVACDGTILWLAAQGTDLRRLYARADRYDVWLAEPEVGSLDASGCSWQINENIAETGSHGPPTRLHD
jgi:hypothetical protein